MKKAVAIIVLLAAVVAAVLVIWQRSRRNLEMPPGLAAELAPAGATLFIEVPSVARTFERWKKNGLYEIYQEPEWQDFIARWDEFAAANASSNSMLGSIEELMKAAPAGLFFAVGKPGPFPNVVGGFPYRGKKSAVEGLVREFKDLLFKRWPGAKSELSKIGEIEIETISSATPLEPGALDPLKDALPHYSPPDPKVKFFPKVHLAYHANWFFFATDKDLLAGTLDRYLKKPGAAPGLAQDAVFQETLKHGSPEPDLTLWVRLPEIYGVVGEMSPASVIVPGSLLADPKSDANPAQAFLYSFKLDGAVMRDRFYLHLAQPPQLAPSEHRSLALTNPLTFAYLEVNSQNLIERTKWLGGVIKAVGADDYESSLNRSLNPFGLSVGDIATTFGPEFALSSAWPDGVFSRLTPDGFAAVEIRDPVKAGKFAEFLASGLAKDSQNPAIKKTEGGITRWTAPEPVAPAGPYKLALALTDRHLIFGITPAAVDSAIQQFSAKAPNLATKPGSAYPAAVQGVNPPHGGLLYVDTKIVFERLYDSVKPFVSFQLVGSPEYGKYFDAGKLPQGTTFSKHLAPVVLSYGVEGPGWLVESTSTVSLTPLLPLGFAAYGWASKTTIPFSPPPTILPAIKK